jgi:carbonic anhydrase
MFEYYDVDFKQVKTTKDGAIKSHETLKLKYETNSLRIKYENFGELVTIDGSVYRAQEIVFRTPAEHTIDGQKYDMEMQVIHYGQTSGDISKQAVLCFLFSSKPGVYNKFIDDVDFFNLPNPLHPVRELINNIYIPKVFYNSENEDVAIMKDFSFYTYQGSLTEPPCTERTIMYVAAKPIQLGTTAIQLFQEALRMPDLQSSKGDVIVSTKLPMNSRKVQKRNGRHVYYYDAGDVNCAKKTSSYTPRTVGHYEKVPKHLTQYFYVSGEKPSGLPGALVVSKNEAKLGDDIMQLN